MAADKASMGLHITAVIHDVVSSFADKGAYALKDSRYAPGNRERRRVQDNRIDSPNNITINNPQFNSDTPSTHSANGLVYVTGENLGPVTMSDRPDSNHPVANVDDAAGFMAAARAIRQQQAAEAVAATMDALDAQDITIKSSADDFFPEQVKETGGFAGFDTQKVSFGDSTEKPIGDEPNPLHVAAANGADGFTPVTEEDSVLTFVGASSPTPAAPVVARDEDRENLMVFKTWGAPENRDKPAARVRRIILKGLPSAWRTPAKVLTLIHGGAIENVHISGSGNASVLFCEPDACMAFYDKYPNGIDVDREKGLTVFVEMGSDVDVVSSQLLFNLSVGASRVVRAVGVDMNITMGQLLRISSACNRKVEKVLDHYVPGDARNVIFRFCSIEDAVRFRGTIIRDPDWEHCNVQYAADPCEVATGIHMD